MNRGKIYGKSDIQPECHHAGLSDDGAGHAVSENWNPEGEYD